MIIPELQTRDVSRCFLFDTLIIIGYIGGK
jgi:hypothetical protein